MTQWNAPQGGRDPYGEGAPGHDPYAQPAAGYGQPGQYPDAGYGQPSPFQQSQSYGIVGTVLTLLGGICVVVALTGLNWFKGGVSFSDLHDAASNDKLSGFASAYFGWLAWTFLIVVVIAGVLASAPTPALRIFRIIGIVVGLAAAGLSFLAVDYRNAGNYSDYLSNARVGFYLAVFGFLLAGIGAGIGPKRS
jgi:hypothetical protein